MSSRAKFGFTLIELSITLAVVGMLIGAVLSGRELVEIARINSELSQLKAWNTAVNVYQQKYLYLPGDDPKAAREGLGTPGNGDGIIEFWHGSTPFEGLNAWQHLGGAGLIPGTYSGAAGMYSCTLGSTYPASKLNAYSTWSLMNSGYVFFTADYTGMDTNNGSRPYIGDGGVWLTFISGDTVLHQCASAARGGVSANILHHLDSKIDDGMPFTGNVRLMGQDGIFNDTSLQIMCSTGSYCTYPSGPACATGMVASGGQYTNDNTVGACPLAYGLQ